MNFKKLLKITVSRQYGYNLSVTGVTEFGTVTFHLAPNAVDFTGRFLGGY